jgi:hypothetical protein
MIDCELDYEVVEIAEIYQDGNFEDEYVYDLTMNDATEQTFFGNDILVHNSVYISFDEVMNKLGVEEDYNTRIKLSQVLTKIILKRIDEFNASESQSFYNSENMIFWDSELLASSAIFARKKKYAAHMVMQDGFPCDELLIKGLDIVRSSTPRLFRDNMKVALEKILKGSGEKEIDEFSYDLYEDFKSWTLEQIALPKACNNMGKFMPKETKVDKDMDGLIDLEEHEDNVIVFVTKTPQHMKGAILFNSWREKHKLVDLEMIKDDDKFRLLLLKKGNPLRVDAIGYTDYLPKEFQVDISYIDKPRMFELGYTRPMTMLYEAIGWKIKRYDFRKDDIEDLFE